MIPDSLIVTFPNQTASLISVGSLAELPARIAATDLPVQRPTLVVIGGAKYLSDDDLQRVRSLFTESLAPIAQRFNAVVVDGGTNAGVMRLMGQARAELRATFPLVGVSPKRLVILPNQSSSAEDAAPLEPHHTHFFLVPGDHWGAESEWMASIASAIAQDAPSITILINGGDVTWRDAEENIKTGRSLIVIGETGRTADILAAAVQGQATHDRALQLAQSGQVRLVSLSEGSTALTRIIEEIFKTEA
ncbi:hypothetical protein H6F89_06055 [Cyanobacteria bacterium FACHB-63]|nr:hypothetical protein [Cyanobacteria bacterium FACHB-63]